MKKHIKMKRTEYGCDLDKGGAITGPDCCKNFLAGEKYMLGEELANAFLKMGAAELVDDKAAGPAPENEKPKSQKPVKPPKDKAAGPAPENKEA